MSRPVPDAVLLGLIKAHSTHGYDLLERFHANKHLGRMWHLSASQVYAVLKRLEENGAIHGVEVRVEDAPSRREFSILPAGDALLKEWLYDEKPSASLHRIRVVFLSRVYIARLLGQPIKALFDNQISACKTQMSTFQEERQLAESEMEILALDLVIHQLSAAIDWLESKHLLFS